MRRKETSLPPESGLNVDVDCQHQTVIRYCCLVQLSVNVCWASSGRGCVMPTLQQNQNTEAGTSSKGKWPHLGQELPPKRGSKLGRTMKGRKPQRCEDAQLTTGHRQNRRAVGQLSAQHQDKPVTSADLQGVYDPDSLNNLIPQCQLLSDCAKCHLATCLISLWKDYKAWLTCSLHLEKRGC